MRVKSWSSVPYATRDWNSNRVSSGVYAVAKLFIPSEDLQYPPRQRSRGLA
jgi:hypothetical protein